MIISLVESTKPRILGTFETESLKDLAAKVSTADWCPGTFSDGKRHAESWTGTDLLVFDVDEGLTIVDAEKRLEAAGVQYVLLESKSHQKPKKSGSTVKPPCDRFRAILPLERRITSVEELRATWKIWERDLFEGQSDQKVKDPARFFYASPEIHCGQDEGQRVTVMGAAPVKHTTPEALETAERRLEGWPMPERFHRATNYMKGLVAAGGIAVEGKNGDDQTLYVARAVGWDFGLSEELCLDLMWREWNPHCKPPWPKFGENSLFEKIEHAYGYTTEHVFGRKLIQNAKDTEEREKFLAAHPPVADNPTALKPPEVPIEPEQKEWTPQMLLGTTVPVLDEAFAKLRSPEGPPTTLFLMIDDRNQAQVQGPQVRLRMREYLAERYKSTTVTLTEKTEDNTIHHWENQGRLLAQEPAALTFADDDRISFCRLPWMPAKGDCSAWHEFTDRCSDPEAVKAYIGACFTPENKSRQALYLKGNGRDGKSTFAKVIGSAMGSGVAAINDTAVTESKRFLLSTIYGKRVVIYGDCQLDAFCKSGPYRQILSGDAQPIEFKGVGAFQAEIRCKLIVASNHEPQIRDTDADKSRLVLIDVRESKQKDDPTWEKRLKEQLPAFVHECLEAYAHQCPNGGDILVSEVTRESVRAATDDYEAPFADLIDRYFDYDPSGQVDLPIFRRVISEDFNVTDSLALGRLRRFLEGHRVTKKRHGGGSYFFQGLKLKPASERMLNAAATVKPPGPKPLRS